MPTILAIETSTELASVALLRGPRLLVRASSGVQNHSQTVLPMVQALLDEAGCALADCDAIAFGAGPGSFTGVRTACGIAQGLAFGAGLPVIPVITLQAMAQAGLEQGGARDVLAVLDARMGEVYWAQYRFDGAWQAVVEPCLSAASAVKPAGAVIACGNGLTAYREQLEPALLNGAQPEWMPHAAQVAALARTALGEGHAVAPDQASPLYLRNKVALTTAERAAKAAA
jgi:tRNA threonylcarbamoyladenosine biosynthesis protein TsaB